MPLYLLLLKGYALHLPLENSTSFPPMLVSGTYVVTHLECVRIDLSELIKNGFHATAVEQKNKGPRNNVAMSSTEEFSTHGPCDKNFQGLWLSPKKSKCTRSTKWSCSKLCMETFGCASQDTGCLSCHKKPRLAECKVPRTMRIKMQLISVHKMYARPVEWPCKCKCSK